MCEKCGVPFVFKEDRAGRGRALSLGTGSTPVASCMKNAVVSQLTKWIPPLCTVTVPLKKNTDLKVYV